MARTRALGEIVGAGSRIGLAALSCHHAGAGAVAAAAPAPPAASPRPALRAPHPGCSSASLPPLLRRLPFLLILLLSRRPCSSVSVSSFTCPRPRLRCCRIRLPPAPSRAHSPPPLRCCAPRLCQVQLQGSGPRYLPPPLRRCS